MTNRIRLAVSILTLTLAGPARAAVVFIDHYDNALAPDGYYALAYPDYYFAGQYNGDDGEKASDADLSLSLLLLRGVVYRHLGGIPFAFQIILPVGELREGGKLFAESQSSSGVGDLILSPGVFLYANEKSSTYVSYWFYAYAPTGAYDVAKSLNLGTNHWYFEHQLGFNQTFAKKVVLDLNVNFYHHTENSDAAALPPGAPAQAPLRFELAAIAGWQFTPKLVAGVNAGAYWDLDDAKDAAGEPVAATQGQKIAVGPSVAYQVTDKLGLTFRWTHDVAATNDVQGDDLWLRAAFAF